VKPAIKVVPDAKPEIDISLVPYGALSQVLGGLWTYLKQAADYSSGRSSVDDIVRMILNGQYSLWVVFEIGTNRIVGFFATEIKQYPQRRMLCVQHCAVEPGHLDGLEERMEELSIKFAKDTGCTGIEFVGRPGWRKYSKANGYYSHSVVYQKFFEGT